ncbi:MAG TPA: hypothetical protein VM511_04320 [Luteolibacter sp.]|nr:hypothetical protein [Luteolibacter sp.]
MKTTSIPVFSAVWMALAAQAADLYITDFAALNGSIGAAGVWRNSTTSSTVPLTYVSLSQIGGVVKPADTGTQRSIIDNSAPWQDIPSNPPFVPFTIDCFNPNYDGDFINIELKGGGRAVVVINFNALVSDPVLNFTDVDVQSALIFNKPFTVVGGTSNLSATPTIVRTTGTNIGAPFYTECAGSLKFTGIHNQLIIGIYNAGTDPDAHDDRTGFSVSTEVLPVPLQVMFPSLAIHMTGDQLLFTWPKGSISYIRQNTNLSASWNNVATNLENTDYWVTSKSMFGARSFFQGVAPPPPP